MDTTTSDETTTYVKELLERHIKYLSDLWSDLQLFQKLETQHPDEDYSDTEQELVKSIEKEQRLIIKIRRGNYESL